MQFGNTCLVELDEITSESGVLIKVIKEENELGSPGSAYYYLKDAGIAAQLPRCAYTRQTGPFFMLPLRLLSQAQLNTLIDIDASRNASAPTLTASPQALDVLTALFPWQEKTFPTPHQPTPVINELDAALLSSTLLGVKVAVLEFLILLLTKNPRDKVPTEIIAALIAISGIFSLADFFVRQASGYRVGLFAALTRPNMPQFLGENDPLPPAIRNV